MFACFNSISPFISIPIGPTTYTSLLFKYSSLAGYICTVIFIYQALNYFYWDFCDLSLEYQHYYSDLICSNSYILLYFKIILIFWPYFLPSVCKMWFVKALKTETEAITVGRIFSKIMENLEHILWNPKNHFMNNSTTTFVHQYTKYINSRLCEIFRCLF